MNQNKPLIAISWWEKQRRFVVKDFGNTESVKRLQSFPSATFHNKSKVWTVHSAPRILHKLVNKFQIEYKDSYTRDKFDSILGGYALYESQNKTKKKDVSWPTDYTFKIKPYENQLAAFNWARNLPAAGIFMEVGCGKTKVALDLVNDKIQRGIIKHALVIVPKTIIYKWGREVEKNTDLSYVVIDGNKKKRLDQLASMPQVTIINFEGVISTQEWFKKSPMYGAVVVDESHKLKNPKSKRSKAILAIPRKFSYALTGTPVAGNLMDLWGQFAFLDGGESLYSNFYVFRTEYFYDAAKGMQWPLFVPRPDKVEALHSRVDFKSIRYIKQECVDLPDQVYEYRDVELTPQQRKAYKDIMDQSITFVNGNASVSEAKIVDIMRFSQITSGFLGMEDGSYKDIPGGNPKLNELMDLLTGELNGDKVIVWVRFKRDIENIRKALSDAGIAHTHVDGSVVGKERDDNINRFQNPGGPLVIVAQINTASVGVDITAAGTAVYYSYDYKWVDFHQSLGRNHRRGTEEFGHEKITYIMLRANKTIDKAILSSMKKKQDFSDKITKDDIRKILLGETGDDDDVPF